MKRFWLKLFRRRQMQHDLEAELAFHREMSVAGGNALPVGRVREEAYDAWRFNFVENLWRDLVYAARGLRRNPALVCTALLSLALGIGANTTMFSLGIEFLFSEPSVRDPKSVVYVRLAGSSHTTEKVVRFVRDSGIFQDITGVKEEASINWNDGSETRTIFGVFATRNYFQALGTPVALGRGFMESDPKEVVVLRDAFWRKYFNADPAVLGRVMNLDGRQYTIIGVLPPSHRTLTGFGYSPDVYLPQYLDNVSLAIYARLKPGVTPSQVRAGLLPIAQMLDKLLPESFKYAEGITVTPIAGFARLQHEEELGISLFFALLLSVTGLVLLIACVNVASVLLARASSRRPEIAIRLALGASRGRLLQQLLAESMLLSLLGAALGLGLSQGAAKLLASVQLPLPMPVHLRIEPDWRVTLYAALLAIVATIACGLLPAWQSVQQSLVEDFHRGSKMKLRRVLVVAQVAISLVVLFTSFLFLRNLLASTAIDPGFDLRHTVRADVHLPPAAYADAARQNLYAERAIAELQAIPGMESAAAARIVPFTDGSEYGGTLKFPDTKEHIRSRFNWNAVTPSFFATMSIPVRMGRTFDTSDRGCKVAIVNRTFAQRYLGKTFPIGRAFLWGDEKVPFVVVGVVEGTKNVTLGEDPKPQLYEPLWQVEADNRSKIQLLMRSAISPVMQLEPVRQALRRVEPGAGAEVSTLYASIAMAFLPSQIGAVLLGSIGLLALLLAAIGLYGVMVYSVVRRTREIGVRMAIGARPANIARMILLDSARLIATGSAIGLVAAFFIAKPFAMFLVPGLRTSDPISFAAVVAVLALTGMIASWGPMRRAATIDPMTSLRQD
jgi:predicted permease